MSYGAQPYLIPSFLSSSSILFVCPSPYLTSILSSQTLHPLSNPSIYMFISPSNCLSLSSSFYLSAPPSFHPLVFLRFLHSLYLSISPSPSSCLLKFLASFQLGRGASVDFFWLSVLALSYICLFCLSCSSSCLLSVSPFVCFFC